MATISLVIKWSGQEIHVDDVDTSADVAQLKQLIMGKTGVLPGRQKLLGLKVKGKPAGDDVKLSSVNLKPGMKIMMMGTREEALQKIIAPPKEVTDQVVNDDFDIDEDDYVATEKREEFLAKIQRRVDTLEFKEINPPRADKKLLVLDIDYTLFDHRSFGETGEQLMRPYLHEFLTSAYQDYDIVIWSATGMKWIEAKMQELAVTTNTNYKLAFMMDSSYMITVHTEKYGTIETKPLGVVWGKYPDFYSKHNTIMFDDLRRNFLMNPSSGLKIRAYRNCHDNRSTDRELLHLSKYLKLIAKLDDFEVLDHSRWEKYLKRHEDELE